MKDFFKPEDCDFVKVRGIQAVDGALVHSKPVNNESLISLTRANALLQERGTRVYASATESYTKRKFDYDTHQALLICLEPIEADSEEKVLKELSDLGKLLERK